MKKLKKNGSSPNEPANYDKGILFYEELRPNLVRHNISATYTLGIDLVSKYGLKAFLNKFKRKRIGSEPAINPTNIHTREIQALREVESNGSELIFLLADMIRSTGCLHGTE